MKNILKQQNYSSLMKKLLVTGSAGFIGFHFALYCLKKGYQVIGVDNINNYYDRNFKNSKT